MAVGRLTAICLPRKMWCIRNAYRIIMAHEFITRLVGGLANGDHGHALGETGMATVITLDTVGDGLDIGAG